MNLQQLKVWARFWCHRCARKNHDDEVSAQPAHGLRFLGDEVICHDRVQSANRAITTLSSRGRIDFDSLPPFEPFAAVEGLVEAVEDLVLDAEAQDLGSLGHRARVRNLHERLRVLKGEEAGG